MNKRKHKNKSHVRDIWIFESWKASGCGPHKNKKKVLPRKAKYREKLV